MPDNNAKYQCPSVVHCDVHNCVYNDVVKCLCNASDISVCNETACRSGETYCDSFKMKK